MFLVVLKSKLRGKALEIIQAGEYERWEYIQTALQTNVRPKVDYQIANQNLFATKQRPNETVQQFSERIKKAKQLLDDASTRETEETLRPQMLVLSAKLAKQAFEANLANSALRTIVISGNKRTLVESIEYALTQEQKFFPQSTMVTYTHNSNININSNRRINQPNFNRRPQPTNNFFPQGPSRPQYCYKCGRSGHFSPQCPENPNRTRVEHRQENRTETVQRPFQGRYQKISYRDVPQPSNNSNLQQFERNPQTQNGFNKQNNSQTQTQTRIRNIYVEAPRIPEASPEIPETLETEQISEY